MLRQCRPPFTISLRSCRHRRFHTSPTGLTKITANANDVIIQWDGVGAVASTTASPASRFHRLWLRDNCQCPQCVHPSNRQKLHSSADVSSTVAFTEAKLVQDCSGREQLKVHWAPGSLQHPRSPSNTQPHDSVYDISWLQQNDPASVTLRRDGLLKPVLWEADLYSKNKRDVNYDDFMRSDDGLRKALEELRDYGLVFIRKVPTNDTEVERIAERFGCIRNTFYGTSWNVKSMPDAKNIAYTSLDLGLHMDLMYFEAPPGLQLLHSLKNSVTGGASIFLDSFKAAAMLKKTNPEAYKALTEIPVTFHYINDGRHMHFRRPTIVENDHNEPVMVYYAPPFQGPLESEEVDRFYSAFHAFVNILKEPSLTYKMMMRPRDCVVFANRRVLHGREEFDAASGERHLKGAYVDWDDFKDRLRVFGRA